MSNDKQLQALLKQYEVVEQEAAENKARIEKVLEQREQQVNQLRDKRDALQKKVRQHETSGRNTALQAGRVEEAASHSEKASRLRGEIARLESDLVEHEKDLQLAIQRANIAQEALLQARIDKKKVEKLQERRQIHSDQTEAALEEQALDEHNSSFRPRGR